MIRSNVRLASASAIIAKPLSEMDNPATPLGRAMMREADQDASARYSALWQIYEVCITALGAKVRPILANI